MLKTLRSSFWFCLGELGKAGVKEQTFESLLEPKKQLDTVEMFW